MQFLFADLCFLHLGRLARPRCCCILYIMYSENISRIILPRNLINDQPFYLIYIGTFLCSIFNLNTIVRWCWIGILTRIWGFVSYQFIHCGKFSIPVIKDYSFETSFPSISKNNKGHIQVAVATVLRIGQWTAEAAHIAAAALWCNPCSGECRVPSIPCWACSMATTCPVPCPPISVQ